MIEVRTPNVRYPVRFANTAEDVAAAIQEASPRGRLLVFSDSHVAPLYLTPLTNALQSLGRTVRTFVVPAGEASKSAASAAKLWDEVFSGDVDRNDTVVALGGGVVGDLSGFMASTIMRGLGFIQVPTTMLAMSDAAIGGKTGINIDAGKNLVGAFHQPRAVIAWTDTLLTLSKRELASGMAEVVKSALIDGEASVQLFRETARPALEGDRTAIEACARIGAGLKARIVSEDELEHGVRAYLNLGHTFAHAIEHASGYGEWTHGEAVAAGMVLAARYSEHIGACDASVVALVREMVREVQLPEEPPKMSLDEWVHPIFRDKKRSGDQVKLILLRGAGSVFGHPTSFDELAAWLKANVVG